MSIFKDIEEKIRLRLVNEGYHIYQGLETDIADIVISDPDINPYKKHTLTFPMGELIWEIAKEELQPVIGSQLYKMMK